VVFRFLLTPIQIVQISPIWELFFNMCGNSYTPFYLLKKKSDYYCKEALNEKMMPAKSGVEKEIIRNLCRRSSLN
jgi:hypothetical protein